MKRLLTAFFVVAAALVCQSQEATTEATRQADVPAPAAKPAEAPAKPAPAIPAAKPKSKPAHPKFDRAKFEAMMEARKEELIGKIMEILKRHGFEGPKARACAEEMLAFRLRPHPRNGKKPPRAKAGK